MAYRLIDLNLPEWAWLSGGDHEINGDPIKGRNIVLHVRSASVIEFFERDNFVPASDEICTYNFDYNNDVGLTEYFIAAMHYSATVDDIEAKNDILRAASEWYCNYLTWEDNNIATNELAGLN